MNQPKRRIAGLTCVELFLLGGAAALLLVCCPFPHGSREAARRTQCRNNLHEIAIALHNYHDFNRSFPAAYTTDSRGRPRHSWRVYALPYLDQAPLYNAIDLNKTWNAPVNAALAEHAGPLRVYQCPSEIGERGDGELWTSYVAIVGPHTAWPDDQPARIMDFTDGTSNTFLVVESHNSGIHWMEPRDLHVTQMATTINPFDGQGVSSAHEGGSFVVMGDGSVRFVSENVDRNTLRRLIERDDGEDVSDF